MEDLQTLILQADTSASVASSKSFMVSILNGLRKSKLRRPDLVVKYGKDLLLQRSSGIDVWVLNEQVFCAALDVGEMTLADECLKRLERKFPHSSRVLRLGAMKLEYLGKYELALSMYDELLEKYPANILIMKRKAAMLTTQGKTEEAATELNNILRIFPSDATCWIHLSELHLSKCDFAAAAYCLEELVLLDPHCAPAHTRLADAYYSLGGYDNLLSARQQYSISLTIQCPRNNLRALYGLIAAASALEEEIAKGALSVVSKTGSGKQSVAVNAEMLMWAKEQLHNLNEEKRGGNQKKSNSLFMTELVEKSWN